MLYVDCSYSYYSIALDNTDIFTLSKGKILISTNGVETYNKETLDNEIRRLIIANAQLITDKIETEKVKINLEADKIRLFDKKNSLIAKKEELQTEIVILNAAGPFNILVCGYQDPLLRPIRNKFKVKRLTLFDNIKENF